MSDHSLPKPVVRMINKVKTLQSKNYIDISPLTRLFIDDRWKVKPIRIELRKNLVLILSELLKSLHFATSMCGKIKIARTPSQKGAIRIIPMSVPDIRWNLDRKIHKRTIFRCLEKLESARYISRQASWPKNPIFDLAKIMPENGGVDRFILITDYLLFDLGWTIDSITAKREEYLYKETKRIERCCSYYINAQKKKAKEEQIDLATRIDPSIPNRLRGHDQTRASLDLLKIFMEKSHDND